MSLFKHLKTYSWSNCIYGKPFEIKVFARNAEEARREVFEILAEIARVKPYYDALDKEIWSRYHKMDDKKTLAQVTNGTSPVEKTTEQLREERAGLVANIPADFFNGSYAADTFDYTANQSIGSKNLGEFIRTTEPTCCGPVRTVSFRSCLYGYGMTRLF